MNSYFSKLNILKSSNEADKRQELFNFNRADKAILCLTMAWLVFEVYEYQIALINRPSILFETSNYYTKLFMSALPSTPAFFGVIILSFGIACFLLFRDHSALRLLLAFFIAWLNIAQWSYEFLSCVGFFIIYAHLFSVLIPKKKWYSDDELDNAFLSVKWYYTGFFWTYTLAGIWKVGGLLYKTFTCSDCVTWLHPKAAWINAAVSMRDYDFPLNETLFNLLDVSIVWQLGFVLVLAAQVASILVVFLTEIRVWVLFLLIVMHTINSVFFATTFVVQPIVVFCLLLPYHRIFKQEFALYCTNLSKNERLLQ